MTRRILIAFAVAILPAAAWAKPNLSGTFKINAAKSNYGDFPAPEKYELKINHNDPNLQYTTTRSGFQGGEDLTYELKYTTDGKESTNTIRNMEAKGTAKWDGDVLVIESTRNTPNGEFKIAERWSVADDGKALVIETRFSGGFGDASFKTHLDKQ
jgi:hypothetical protein